ncbi:MAG: ketopantoate reductase family protein [Betaproteobacteria bacterium]|nr:MAG: ketopantoate reductase family protein [Betaproteobacteria bacterium]
MPAFGDRNCSAASPSRSSSNGSIRTSAAPRSPRRRSSSTSAPGTDRSKRRMRIAVIGAGAVGSVLGSLLWRAGEDVVLVGRAAHVAAIRAAGLDVEGALGGFKATPHAEERLSGKPELALLTVKTQDIVAALRGNAAHLAGVPIVVLQNGLRGDELAATVVPAGQLVSGVVALHAEYLVPGRVVLMQSEGLLIGRPDGRIDEVVERVRAVLEKALPTSVSANIRGARWTKLIVNLNNVLPALCDASFKQVYKDPFLRGLAVGLMREGIAVAERAGIRLEPIPGTSLPLAEADFRWPLKGSTWQSVARARPTEIEYLNGEVVRLGKELQVPTPLNALVVALMQRVTSERRYLAVREIERASQEAQARALKAA